MSCVFYHYLSSSGLKNSFVDLFSFRNFHLSATYIYIIPVEGMVAHSLATRVSFQIFKSNRIELSMSFHYGNQVPQSAEYFSGTQVYLDGYEVSEDRSPSVYLKREKINYRVNAELMLHIFKDCCFQSTMKMDFNWGDGLCYGILEHICHFKNLNICKYVSGNILTHHFLCFCPFYFWNPSNCLKVPSFKKYCSL